MPGLVLEISILLANPNLARQLALRTQESFGFGHYLTLFVGLFLAFVIGNTLMLLVALIQWGNGHVYNHSRLSWELLERHALLPVLTRLTHPRPASAPNTTPPPARTPPKWISALYVRTLTHVRRLASTEPTDAYLWWESLAKRLLHRRYGLREEDLPHASFMPLQTVLTVPTREEIRGSLLVNASHATGWAALIASKFAPALRANWYITSAFFLIAYGFLHDWYVANRMWNPDIGDTMRLRAILREFPRLEAAEPDKPSPGNHDDKEGEET